MTLKTRSDDISLFFISRIRVTCGMIFRGGLMTSKKSEWIIFSRLNLHLWGPQPSYEIVFFLGPSQHWILFKVICFNQYYHLWRARFGQVHFFLNNNWVDFSRFARGIWRPDIIWFWLISLSSRLVSISTDKLIFIRISIIVRNSIKLKLFDEIFSLTKSPYLKLIRFI